MVGVVGSKLRNNDGCFVSLVSGDGFWGGFPVSHYVTVFPLWWGWWWVGGGGGGWRRWVLVALRAVVVRELVRAGDNREGLEVDVATRQQSTQKTFLVKERIFCFWSAKK